MDAPVARRKYDLKTDPSNGHAHGLKIQALCYLRHGESDCPTCARIQQDPGEFGPYHDASARCESGKRNHCSCDTCF